MRVKVSVPQVLTPGTLAQLAQLFGTGLLQAQVGFPLQPEVATLVFSVHGEVCISDVVVSCMLMEWKREERLRSKCQVTYCCCSSPATTFRQRPSPRQAMLTQGIGKPGCCPMEPSCGLLRLRHAFGKERAIPPSIFAFRLYPIGSSAR